MKLYVHSLQFFLVLSFIHPFSRPVVIFVHSWLIISIRLQENTFDFSFSVPAKIWKVKLDTHTGDLALELRDEPNRDVFFLVFYWAAQETSEFFNVSGADWWTTLSEFKQGTLFLDHYSDVQDPSTKSILTHDLNVNNPINEPVLVRYPSIFWEGSKHFGMIKAYLGKEIAMGVEYFEESDTAVFSYYVLEATGFSRHLVILKNEREQHHMQLEPSIMGFAEGSFMVINRTIVFITNYNQVNGVTL